MNFNKFTNVLILFIINTMSLLLLDNWHQIRIEFHSQRILRIKEILCDSLADQTIPYELWVIISELCECHVSMTWHDMTWHDIVSFSIWHVISFNVIYSTNFNRQFSVEFSVLTEKINVFRDFDNHIMFLSFKSLF